MGLLDELRMSTGLALEPAEAYLRAFEKGVLLGPEHFGAAAEMFRKAVPKLATVDAGLAGRAEALAWLYAFLSSRDPRAGYQASEALRHRAHIEAPGTLDELMEGPKLGAEIDARLHELAASSVPAGRAHDAAEAHRRAAYAWLPLGDYRPVTFVYFGDDGFTEDAMTRFFLQAGLASMHDGDGLIGSAPESAAEHYAMAAQAFARCGAEDLRSRAREALRLAQLERRCWFCGLRAQGMRTHMRVLSVGLSDYVARLGSVDPDKRDAIAPGEGIFACGPCADAVDTIAEQRASAVRQELQYAVQELRRVEAALEARIRSLEVRMVLR